MGLVIHSSEYKQLSAIGGGGGSLGTGGREETALRGCAAMRRQQGRDPGDASPGGEGGSAPGPQGREGGGPGGREEAHSPSGRMARSRVLPSDVPREDPRGLARPGIKLFRKLDEGMLEGLSRSQSEIRPAENPRHPSIPRVLYCGSFPKVSVVGS